MMFDFIIEHIDRKENMLADVLSRSGQDREIKRPSSHLLENQITPSQTTITTNYFTFHKPNIHNSYNMPYRLSHISGPPILSHRQTVNASSPSIVQPDDLDLVWTYATPTRAQAQQEELQRSVNNQPNFQIKINKRSSNFEPEEYSEWEEDPQQEWQIGEVQPQEPEEMEDWERISNGPDMERTIRRSPSPTENEWNPTLDGTVRIRRNDPRKCADEVPKYLKTHMPPPPPPSPIVGSSTQHWNAIDFCWNCRQEGHIMSQCKQPPLAVHQVSEKIPLQKEPISQNKQEARKAILKNLQKKKAARKCTNCQQQGHNRTKCLLPLKEQTNKCSYCKGHHGINRYNKRENDQGRVKRGIPEVEYIRNKEKLGQELEL